MPSEPIFSLKDLLAQELELCRKLRTMVSRELEAIVLDHDMDELLRLLARKDEVISQLQLLADARMDLLAALGVIPDPQDSDRRLIALFPEDEELSSLLSELQEVVDSILRAEDEAQAELEKYAGDLREQLASRMRARSAASSYHKMRGPAF